MIDDNDLIPGENIGCYVVQGRLGKGGMGAVYHAVHESFKDLEVAIKVIHSDSDTGHAELVERLREECNALAKLGKLNHPNIVSIQHADTYRGVPYVVMPFAKGKSLDDLLQEGRVSAQDAVRVCAYVADGLAAAHSQGIVHRDIKPKNVMVALDVDPPNVKIIDFGISKVLAENPNLTGKYDNIFGSLAYMPPERLSALIQGDREYKDVPTGDVYSLGVMLYHVLTNMADMPTDDQNPLELAQKLDRWVPKQFGDPNLDVLIQQMLNKDWAARLSARRAAAELHGLYNLMVNAGSTQQFKVRAAYNQGELLAFLSGEVANVDESQVGAVLFVRSDAYVRLKGDERIGSSDIVAAKPGKYQQWVIGRGDSADVTIRDGSVSREHAVLEYQNGRYYLEDRSTNGTTIDGSKLAPGERRELEPGQVVTFGKSNAFVFGASPYDLRKNLRADGETKRF